MFVNVDEPQDPAEDREAVRSFLSAANRAILSDPCSVAYDNAMADLASAFAGFHSLTEVERVAVASAWARIAENSQGAPIP
jgi:hypothetical protein